MQHAFQSYLGLCGSTVDPFVTATIAQLVQIGTVVNKAILALSSPHINYYQFPPQLVSEYPQIQSERRRHGQNLFNISPRLWRTTFFCPPAHATEVK